MGGNLKHFFKKFALHFSKYSDLHSIGKRFSNGTSALTNNFFLQKSIYFLQRKNGTIRETFKAINTLRILVIFKRLATFSNQEKKHRVTALKIPRIQRAMFCILT